MNRGNGYEKFKCDQMADLNLGEAVVKYSHGQYCYTNALHLVQSQPKVGEWIPCSERLPERYCHCLVTRRNEYEDGFDTDVREDVYLELEGVWDWHSKFEGLHDEIIAWMPLPEPYEGK